MMALSKRAREEWIRGLTIGIICVLVGCAATIVFSSWDMTSKALGIIFIIVLLYISYNEFDKRLLSSGKSRSR